MGVGLGRLAFDFSEGRYDCFCDFTDGIPANSGKMKPEASLFGASGCMAGGCICGVGCGGNSYKHNEVKSMQVPLSFRILVHLQGLYLRISPGKEDLWDMISPPFHMYKLNAHMYILQWNDTVCQEAVCFKTHKIVANIQV